MRISVIILFREIKIIENPICKIFEIDVTNRGEKKAEDLFGLPDDDLDFIHFADMLFEDTRYLAEKRKGGESSHKDHQAIKAQVDALQ